MNSTQTLVTSKRLRLLGVLLLTILGTLLLFINLIHAGGGGMSCPDGVCQGHEVGKETRDFTEDMHHRATQGDIEAFNLGQKALQQAVEDVMNLVATGGPDGGPLFIQDFGRHLSDAVDRNVQHYINELGYNMQSPFTSDIQGALQQVHSRKSRGELLAFDAPSMGDPQAFFGGDFSQGGWDAWYEVVNNPEVNTPIGAYHTAQRGMSTVARKTEREEITKANWADGFKAIEECDAGGRNCQITTPGRIVADMLSKALGAPFDTMAGIDSAEQEIDAAFSQLASEALSGANGLLGAGLDAGTILQALLNELGLDLSNLDLSFDLNQLLRDLFAEFGSDDRAAILAGSESILSLLTNALETEEEYLEVVNQGLDEELGDEEELLEMANEALSNITTLNDLIIRYEEVTELIVDTITEDNAEDLMDIVSEYSTLKDDLHNQADITLLRTELGL